jgi:TPR repeat protein
MLDWARMKQQGGDEGAAPEQFQRLAAEGCARAQVIMGHIVHQGKCGLERNDATAAMWYRRAAQQGYRLGCLFYVWCLLTGSGCARDLDAAVVFYGRAGEH